MMDCTGVSPTESHWLPELALNCQSCPNDPSLAGEETWVFHFLVQGMLTTYIWLWPEFFLQFRFKAVLPKITHHITHHTNTGTLKKHHIQCKSHIFCIAQFGLYSWKQNQWLFHIVGQAKSILFGFLVIKVKCNIKRIFQRGYIL